MSKLVTIQKVGASTLVTVSYEGNPDEKTIKLVGSTNLTINKGCIVVDDDLSFTLSEVAENYGATTLQELLVKFAENYLFTSFIKAGGGFVEIYINSNASIVQSDLLKNKTSIAGVVVEGIITQNPTGYNPITGTFNFEVSAGEKLIVFFTN